ncbi:hypothetical protein BC829DRAFT_406076, partial [Chytridium lagenaria]
IAPPPPTQTQPSPHIPRQYSFQPTPQTPTSLKTTIPLPHLHTPRKTLTKHSSQTPPCRQYDTKDSGHNTPNQGRQVSSHPKPRTFKSLRGLRQWGGRQWRRGWAWWDGVWEYAAALIISLARTQPAVNGDRRAASPSTVLDARCILNFVSMHVSMKRKV